MKSELDKQDLRLLDLLQRHGRISSQDLSEKANMSSATCWRRVRALEEADVIQGYSAILDRQSIGLAVCAFAHVSIDRQYSRVVGNIAEKIRRRPEVLECYATTGDADFTLRVVTTDMDAYDRFLNEFLFKLDGIGQVRSSIALREIKQTTQLPLG
ncbi:MAG: Lrp/AsnC family transcriptional regulator [Pseudomonadota bacterium]